MNEEPGLLEVQENNTMITFGRKLKHLRQKNHLTQKELGMAVGFPESCADVRISQYESDVRTPKEDLMKLFASKLGVPVELFTVPVLSEPREYEAVAFQECKVLQFDSPDEAWLDFVAANRQGTYQGEKYDLIYGAVANDDVYRTIALYMTGVLDKEQTLSSLKIRKLFNQLVFATEKSLQYLKFEGRELV